MQNDVFGGDRRSASSNCNSNSTLLGTTDISQVGQTVTGAIVNLSAGQSAKTFETILSPTMYRDSNSRTVNVPVTAYTEFLVVLLSSSSDVVASSVIPVNSYYVGSNVRIGVYCVTTSWSNLALLYFYDSYLSYSVYYGGDSTTTGLAIYAK